MLSIGGYFLYGALDAALERVQIAFAKKVAGFLKEKPEAIKTPAASSPAPPLTLETLFATDFPNVMKFTITGEITFENGERVAIKSQEYADFVGNSAFIGFYVPQTTLPFRTCVRLSNSIPATLDKINKSVFVSLSGDGGETSTRLSQLVFSGRVFVYHMEPLTLQQKATCADYFKRKQLDVQFRGLSYLQERAMEQRLSKP